MHNDVSGGTVARMLLMAEAQLDQLQLRQLAFSENESWEKECSRPDPVYKALC